MTALELLKELRDEAEKEYVRTRSAEDWGEYLALSIEVAEQEQE